MRSSSRFYCARRTRLPTSLDPLLLPQTAHIDGLRAPWFLFALRRPEGISEDHWRFQAKLGQPTRTQEGGISTAVRRTGNSMIARSLWPGLHFYF
jgi:hypothetical protein